MPWCPRLLSAVLVVGLAACAQAPGEADGGASGGSNSGSSGGASGGTAGGGSGGSTSGSSVPSDAGFAAPHRSFPQLAQGPGVLDPLTLVLVTSEGDDGGPTLDALTEALLATGWWTTAQQTFGLGAVTFVSRTGAPIGGAMTDQTALDYVGGVVADGGPEPDGKTVYLLFLPDGVSFAAQGQAFCWWSTPYPPDRSLTLGDSLAIVAYGGTSCGGFGPFSTLDVATLDLSASIVDAAVGAVSCDGYNLPHAPSSEPWDAGVFPSYFGFCAGPADLCNGTNVSEASDAGTITAVRYFSNDAASAGGDPCVPAVSQPYFNVSVPQDWYPVSPGTTASIPLTGWSTAPMKWELDVGFDRGSGSMAALPASALSLQSDAGTVTVSNCGTFAQMSNGTAATLGVAVPAGAASADYAVIGLYSYVLDPRTCYPRPGQDLDHFWPVGIYVP